MFEFSLGGGEPLTALPSALWQEALYGMKIIYASRDSLIVIVSSRCLVPMCQAPWTQHARFKLKLQDNPITVILAPCVAKEANCKLVSI